MKNSTIITEIDGQGRKIAAVVLEFDGAPGPADRRTDNYVVENQTVKELLVCAEPEWEELFRQQIPADCWADRLGGNSGKMEWKQPGHCPTGNCVILILDKNRPEASVKKMLGRGPEARLAVVSPELVIHMKEEQSAVTAVKVKDAIADSFDAGQFRCSDGFCLNYQLFIPEGYDPLRTYPLVLFIHDAGSCSEDTGAALAQGNGAAVWASRQEQEKRPCFVLAPQYPKKCAEDDYTVGREAEATMELVKALGEKYSLDKNRIYGTGQSMGCMILCELNIRYPGFFGGCFLVAGQWNPETMPAARHGNLWILVSEKDEKAFPIMGACVENMKTAGAKVSYGSWDAHSPEEIQNAAVEKIAAEGSRINFTWYEGDSVLEEGDRRFPGAFHVKTWEKAYQVEAIREWLFKQHRRIDFSGKHEVLIRNGDGSLLPMDAPYYEAKEVVPGVWQIMSSGDYSYCIAGKERAAAIDTGYGAGNLRVFLEQLCGLPVRTVINTHSHFDHTANNTYFDQAYMAHKAIPLATIPFASFAGIDFWEMDYERIGVGEGFICDLGDKTLEIFDIPDHTEDGIAILDRTDRILFTGDEFMAFGKILSHASLAEFYGYTQKLLEHRNEFDRICAGGGVFPASLLENYDKCAQYILSGHQGEPFDGKAHRPEQLPKGPDGETVYDRMMPHFGDGGAGKMGITERRMYSMEYAGAKIVYE